MEYTRVLDSSSTSVCDEIVTKEIKIEIPKISENNEKKNYESLILVLNLERRKFLLKIFNFFN